MLLWFGAFMIKKKKKKKKKKKNQLRFFSGENSSSLAGNFTMEKKTLFKNSLLHKFFICLPIFKIFVALLKTFRMQNDDMLIFFLRSFRKVRF